ncbi:MAG: phage portal protein [Leptotrichiaceae bacterium]|nr:phage portal protein [Leptotrichiaceae bacterium]MBP7739173.1 phage portal protein [Leptotrichiaceae bacterium]MBP9629674.1 phage portal protein [Leptotrichiaceae bacterium]
MNFIDKGLAYFNPIKAVEREKARKALEIREILNKGYGDHGASTRKKSFRGWITSLGGPKTDIYDHRNKLVERSRDLYMGGAIARGALQTMQTNVIGAGLKLKSTIDVGILGTEDVEIEILESRIENEFDLWADYKIERTGLLDFYGIQDLVFLTTLLNGECLIHLCYFETPDIPYQLKLEVIEPDRIVTPSDKRNDKSVVEGVQIDKNGRIEGYYILDKHPNDDNTGNDYKYISVYGNDGQLNIIHLALLERPNQVRGVPVLSPVMESIKQLDRYTNAELMSAVISSMLTIFIETDGIEQASLGELSNIDESEKVDQTGSNLELGNGAIVELNPGEKANSVNPSRPNAQFDPFMTAILRQIGSSLGVPYELLVMHFTSSYSASRAALLEAWKHFRKRREWLARNFCRVVYEEWLKESIYLKRIEIPRFYEDILIRKAYSKAIWNGPSQGQIDPLKEAKASVVKINNGLSTRTKEVAELNGGDFEQNVRIISRENKILEKKGVVLSGTIEDGEENENNES